MNSSFLENDPSVSFTLQPPEVSHSFSSIEVIGGACQVQQSLEKRFEAERMWHLSGRK